MNIQIKNEFIEPAHINLIRKNLQSILKRTLAKTTINSSAPFQWLRHNYAIHLLEAEKDFHYIQEPLGHSSSKTPEINAHRKTSGLDKVVSPLDNLTKTVKLCPLHI